MSSPFVYLNFPRPNGGDTLQLAGHPLGVISTTRIDEVRPCLRLIEHAVRAGFYAVGYLSYEAAPTFDPALAVQDGATMPLLWFALLPATALNAPLPNTDQDFALGPWQPQTTRAEYDEAIAAIHAAIARGDTYQANYTLRLRAPFSGDAIAFFRQLCRAQEPAYCAYLNLGHQHVLSVSPELFFHWQAGQIIAKPMKGTVRRGRWSTEDAELAAWLAQSEKNRAENVMIVDLLRNDLGRVVQTGTVRVPHLFSVEKYSTLFQMTSTVTARPRPNLTLEELFAALFPCGSITGAPKISTMRLIRDLEQTPREVYCGAVGVLCPDGEALFNVAIRTVWVDTQTETAEYGVGGGITWDSNATDEYAEALTKAALLTEARPPFSLIETMAYHNGQYDLLERHLARLRDSALYFDIPFDEQQVRHALTTLTDEIGPSVKCKVRLLLSQKGKVTLEHIMPAPLHQDTPYPVTFATDPTDATNRFLYHKTTRRDPYDVARASRSDDWDVILWNEEGEVMEFTIGNLVAELEGICYTPPVSSGLLPGTFRAELLAQGTITERILTKADVQRATRLWLINSVRGWVSVSLFLRE